MKAESHWLWVFIITAACAVVTSAEVVEDYSSRTKRNEHNELDAAGQKLSRATCTFTLNILRQLVNEDDNSNIVFSPASLGALLSALQQGADGQTLKQLNQFFRLKPEETRTGFGHLQSLKEETKVDMEWGSRCYVGKGTKLSNRFQRTMKENFGLEVHEIDFKVLTSYSVSGIINKWIKLVTHRKISDLIDPGMVRPDTIMLLIDAIYFKGKWMHRFRKSYLAKHVFQPNPNSSIQTTFLSAKEQFYADMSSSIGAKWVNVPFENERFTMLFVLPTKNHQLSKLIKNLSAQDLYKMFNHRRLSTVEIRIPKFKISEKTFLEKTLWQLGLKDVFSKSSSFQGMGARNIHVTSAILMAHVEVDDEGSTAGITNFMQFLRMKSSNFTFIANEPFLFFLLDAKKKIPLLAGKVARPIS